MSAVNPPINEAAVQDLVMKLVGDWGASMSVALGCLGDRLGYYTALAEKPRTPAELAAATATDERYARPWLVNQAAAGYVGYDAASGRYSLSPEQAAVLASEDTPISFAGAFQVMSAAARAVDLIEEAARIGAGVPWGAHHPDLFPGTRRFFKAGYVGSLIAEWLPALDGMVARLQQGAKVGDIGCGHGASTGIMAQAFPRSRFTGFDSHPPSIDAARQQAATAGLAARVAFDVATATTYPGTDYDLLTFFDCFHDMGNTAAVAKHAFHALKPGGAVMLVEPMAGEKPEDNFNPVGRIYAAASMLICTPCAIADGGPALGTLATDHTIGQIFRDAGFSSFRRATEGPFNRIFEAKK